MTRGGPPAVYPPDTGGVEEEAPRPQDLRCGARGREATQEGMRPDTPLPIRICVYEEFGWCSSDTIWIWNSGDNLCNRSIRMSMHVHW